MLEGLAAWILRTYVGEYVENLNTEQLSIGVGTVDLHDLPLKKTALKGLDLPLEVKSGFIGHLQLSIPLTRPKSEPWIIHINKLYLIAGPQKLNKYDEEEEKQHQWIRKKKQLDAFEAQWQESQQNDQSGFWYGSWWPSLYSSFSTTIVENLQLCITDVHIRYEDATLDKHVPFAFGITIEKLSAQSTNENWDTEEIIENERTIKYKLMDLQNLAVYWDQDVNLVGDLPSSELKNALQRMINRSGGSVGFSKHQYILEPISAQAKVQRNSSALPLKDKKPRFVVDLHVERIPFSLAEFQYRKMMKLVGEFQRAFRQSRYKKWRPIVPVKNNAKVWWQFSVTCILHFIQERNQHHSWAFATNRVHDIVVYVKAYTQHLTKQVLDKAIKEDMDRIEHELTFEELVVLRRIAMDKAQKEIELQQESSAEGNNDDQPTPNVNPAPSQGWLSGWYSWYWQDPNSATSIHVATDGEVQQPSPPLPISPPSTQEEEEFLDELSGHPMENQSIFNRDKVFAHLNIHIGNGCFKLLNGKDTKVTPVIELEFTNARWESEVRPQSSTWEFKMSLGAIHVRDKVNEGTLFPALVAPQVKKAVRSPAPATKASVGALAMSSTSLGLNMIQEFSEPPVFEMKFEQLPPRSKLTYTFSITTQPLDITYNPLVIECITDFFSNDSLNAQYMNVERQLKEAAWLRYEELKNQTKAELRHTLDSMLEGVEMKHLKRWDIQLEISAPRIFVPENFKNRKASVVLVDFGHLSFKNSEAIQRVKKSSEGADMDQDDDSFVTPLSTPPSESEDEGECPPDLAMKLAESLNSEDIQNIMYDKYTFVLSDIQMIVCHARDVGKEIGQAFGSTDLHVVDKFNISLSLDRRIMFTSDPQYPALCLYGNLPSLVFHINEHKCHSLTKCVNQLTVSNNTNQSYTKTNNAFMTSTPTRPSSAAATSTCKEDLSQSMDELYYSMYSSQVTLNESPMTSRRSSKAIIESAVASKTRELMEESKLMMFQFSIDQVSCGVHSRGRLIAELQVHGVSAEYLKRPYDNTMSLKVHSLQLVDAIQGYGPDYELLLSSSQRNWVDSTVKSTTKRDERTLAEAVSSAFSAMADFVMPGTREKALSFNQSVSSNEATMTGCDEDLISLEYQQVSEECPSAEKAFRLATLQFNTINCIANQETLTILMQFFSSAFPSEQDGTGSHLHAVPEEITPMSDENNCRQDQDVQPSLEVNASFRSMNILLVRSIKVNNIRTVRKVAEVTVSEVQINASFIEGQSISGSLGGLQIMDLTPEGSLHQCVLTCGITSDANLPSDNPYRLTKLPDDNDDAPADSRAFTFSLLRPPADQKYRRVLINPVQNTEKELDEIARNVQLSINMATAQYTHTQRFLSELMLCGGDFADSAKEVGESLRQAASSVAMGLVSKKKALVDELDYLSSSFIAPTREPDTQGCRRHSILSDEGIANELLLDGQDFEDSTVSKPNRRVYVSVEIEAPVIHFPRSSSSADVLVANLGEITIRNTHMVEILEEPDDSGATEYDIDRVQLDIKDMSVFSITLSTDDLNKLSHGETLSESLHGGSPSKVPKTGIHLLHKTGLQLCVERRSDVQELIHFSTKKKPVILVDARILTPLKLELSSYTYEQLLNTIDSLGGEEKNFSKVPPPASELTSPYRSPQTQSPSLSPTSSTSSFQSLLIDDAIPSRRVTFAPSHTPIVNISDDQPELEDDITPVRANIIVPHFSIKLCGELKGIEHEFVDIMFHDFYMNFESLKPTITVFDVFLGGLLVKDLLQDTTSSYLYLMSSSLPSSSKSLHRSISAHSSVLSTSCPTVSECGLNTDLSTSLPSCFPESPLRKGIPFRTLSPLRPLKYGKAPSLPSVSLFQEDKDDFGTTIFKESEEERQNHKDNALVTVQVALVKKEDEEFETKYKSVNRLIKVDFNSLDTVVNLQTWVLVLDFFGIGVPQPSPPQPNSSVTTQAPVPLGGASPYQTVNTELKTQLDEEPISTEIELHVQSLTLTLNKSQYPLAKAKVMGLSCDLKMKEGHLTADGRLTSVSLTDMSPHGSLYREKFTSCGDEALSFSYFKYDDPDPDLHRDNDMSLSLRMSSVQYVHTKRFITELIAFCQHFLQLQEVLGRMRAQSAGNEVSWVAGRSARISLDIKAGSPVILIPRSSKSSHMLVADLGDLTVANAFLWEEFPGTIAYPLTITRSLSDASRFSARQKCLLDCMTVDLQEMDLFTAVRVPATVQQTGTKVTYTRQGLRLLKEKCRFNLQVERNLDWSVSKAVSDFLCSGRLSSVYASLDYSQYGLILGMLGENFGEVLEEFERPSSYLQDPLGEPPELEEVWTTLKMSIDLVNVSLELLPVQFFEYPEKDFEQHSLSLARIDFIKSKFEFETFSDWSKTIDLVSTEVIFQDTRDMDDADPCVFKEVLLPKAPPDFITKTDQYLQFEVHYRDTTKKTLLTFLFNHSRIVLIIDYILDTYNFIMGKMFQDEESSKVDDSNQNIEDLESQDSSSNVYQSPSAAHSGVVTKYELQSAQDQEEKTFEMKVNISGTEFVLLENLGSLDTNAVVLKLTAVLAWRPHLHTQKWLSCSVQSLEMFSCIFSCEEETAQSIIDPTAALIELNNARRQLGRRTAGLLDITSNQLPSVEINLHSSLNMRISYNDYKLYLEIFESVTKQLNKAMKADAKPQQQAMEHDFDEKLVKRLVELGFQEEDCIKALTATSGRLEASATWLLENAKPIVPANASDNNSGWQFAGFEVRAGTLCVCLIDDCGDTDVPLIEMSVQSLYFWHDLQATGDGAAHCSMTVEYYNRNVSGWEPWIEPWKCQLHWQQQQQTKKSPKRFLVKLDAPDRLDITVTSTLINMINQTISSWTEDLYGPVERSSSQVVTAANNTDNSVSHNTSVETLDSPVARPDSNISVASTGSGPYRKRAPFVPYAIRNNTGCALVFRTLSTAPSRVIITNSGLKLTPHDNDPDKMSEWRDVPPGREIPFEFSSREKMRHKDTHDFIVHQIVVKTEGWVQVSPVTVDCVGTFFRHAQPDGHAVNSVASDAQPVRIVFKVTLEGGARKLVTVQSALSITNKMDLPLEIKLQGHTSFQGSFTLPAIQPRNSLTIPLHAVTWKIYARPHGVGVGFSSQAIEWKSVSKAFATVGYARECHPIGNGAKFRFCTSVRREGYPEDDPLTEFVPTKRLKLSPQAAHSITILAPLVLVNLLPCDLSYTIKNVHLSGNIKAGRSVPLYSADTDKKLDLGFGIENFNVCENLRIARQDGFIEQTVMHVELLDTKKRSLILNVLISTRPGGALRISIFAPYWLINNTGIPLVFKRESAQQEIAGQFEEHEMARSLTPLLFNFYDRDGPLRCQMRIGKSFHEGSGKPVWCTPFSLDNPREFNRVQARQANGRPDKERELASGEVSRQVLVNVQARCGFRVNKHSKEPVRIITARKWVYDIGIDVRFGRGHYQLTRIVTFATRYQLENRTPHTLAFSQRHFVRDQGTRNPEGTLTALPGALVLFHWARTDLDQLLCIRLNDVSHCQWSGGFRINRDDSFHINMRSINGCSLFVRVEIMLRGATFHVVLTDASQLPPPYRIDNMSEVPVKFFQAGTEDRLRTILQPKQSVPYSWDEPTLPPELALGVVDGSSFGRYFMNMLGSGERLYYYNPIYIVFTHTFTSSEGYHCGSFHARPAGSSPSLDLRELVLDVPQGTAVLLRRKEPLKRSQLWRMTGSGQLRHEGSSPISDPRKSSSNSTGLVLDIDSLAPPTCGKYVRLVLSKPNPRRKHSQTWSFTEDGRMNCDLPGLFVQPRNGIAGLVDGADAVLGPANITKDDRIPIEQCITTCKMRPGSGCIAVKVVPDGPTRVLRISDSLQQADDETDKDWLLVERKGGMRQTTVCSLDAEPDSYDLEMQVRLAGGIGVSVINAVPEELVYGALEQIEIDYLRSSKLETLEVTIGRLQVDNQLFGSPLPVLLYPTPPEKGSKEETMGQLPTLHLCASKERSRLQNVEIFKNLDVSLRNMTLHMEERLLLKLLQFLGYVQQDDDVAVEEADESLYDNQRAVSVSTTASKRYYFERLQLNSLQLKASVASAGRLPEDLMKLKQSLGLTLVNLEDATLDLDAFSRHHPFESLNSLLDSMSKHYYEELRSQAASIVGSIDFLGNPMGLLNDVSSGLEGLVKRGNVGGLFLNVAHGVSDSAAKITGSLSDGLWNASMDTKFQESRQAMRAERYGSSKDHFVAGVKGLGMGLVGGLTSIVTQPIEGAHNSGLSGFITGIGKGIVGTVAKPTAGVLDFASGAAAAVRGQATRSSRYFPPKQSRLRRNCFGPSGAIPRYSSTHAEGQEIMLKLNESNFNEKFVLSEAVRRDKEERLKAIITTEGVYFVRAKGTPSPESIVLLVKYSELFECQPLSGDGKDYIELVMNADNSSVPTPSKNPSKRPRVRCDNAKIAQRVAQKINYSKNLYDEVQQTVILGPKEALITSSLERD